MKENIFYNEISDRILGENKKIIITKLGSYTEHSGFFDKFSFDK